MKYYIIAGEASGDLHGSNLMLKISEIDKTAEFRYWGGDKMKNNGGTLVEHYRNMAFMGFVEVIKNIKTILRFINKCKVDIFKDNPDVLILIDYPGFNLRIAKWAKKKGIKVVYYITPQVWAWHKSRVHILGKYTDKLLVILPFESDFFKKHGYEAIYVGHPLLDSVADFKCDPGLEQLKINGKKILALLPGSRKQEINKMLPVMLEATKNTDFTILVAGAPSIEDTLYTEIIKNTGMQNKVHLIRNKTYDILSVADSALVSSGTATLETALFKVPQVVCYKGNAISYFIAKKLVDVQYISLVNLIVGKEVVKELIQNEFTAENIAKELKNLEVNRSRIIQDYDNLILQLGLKGASERAAKQVIQLLQVS